MTTLQQIVSGSSLRRLALVVLMIVTALVLTAFAIVVSIWSTAVCPPPTATTGRGCAASGGRLRTIS
jgi:hypothetical protein